MSSTGKDWTPPKSAELLYEHLSGNRFSNINQDTAGARTEKELPVGPAEYQLYSLATPNGQKASIACEEFEIEYNAHVIDIASGDQFTSGFVHLNPNSKIPALKHGNINIFESGAILLYLAEKYKKFIPIEGSKRAECFSWLFWQMGGQGPM